MDADVVVVGAGLAGLVATCELADAGRSVVLLDQESEANLGGQAWWSFGGLFLVDSPEQRRMGISDSFELAWQDWQGTAGWDRLTEPDGSPGPDHWGRRWGRAYVELAAGEKRSWLQAAWASRSSPSSGGPSAATAPAAGTATRCRASTSRGAPAPASSRRSSARCASTSPRGGCSTGPATGSTSWCAPTAPSPGCAARCSRPTARPGAWRATATSSATSSTAAQAVVVTSGGIGGNHDLVRANWPERLGTPAGRPAHRRARLRRRPDARPSPRPPAARSSTATGCGTTSRACATGTRSGPGTPSASCPARRRCGSTPAATGCPLPFLPGFDTLGTLDHLRHTGYDHSWFVLNRTLIGKEFALSGSEQNLDLTAEALPRRAPPAGHEGDPVGAGLPRPRRGLGHRRDHRRARREDERRSRPTPRSTPRTSSARSSRATGRSTTRSPRTPRSRRSGSPGATAATGSPSGPSRCTASSTRSTARSSRCGCTC